MSQAVEHKNRRRVVVTGIGTINPLGNNVREFWDNLKIGKSGVRTIQNFDYGDYHVHIGAEIDMPPVRDYFKSPKMIKRLDPFTIYTQVAGMQALRDSGLNVRGIANRVGVVVGVGSGGQSVHLKNIPAMVDHRFSDVSPFYIIGFIPSTSPAFFSQETGIRGPSFSVNSACSSSNHALGTSVNFIRSGMADVMFSGGAEAPMNYTGLIGFGNIMAISQRNDDPTTASRPFDKDRDGFVVGEGAGMLCLEELEHAKARGAKIYAEITGYGFSSDAHDLVAPHPDGDGALEAINLALEDAGLEASQIGLINAHGTSTPLGDKIEAKVLNRVLGENGGKVPVHSTKSMVGHLLGASGAVEGVAIMLAFEENVVHKSANLIELDPEINLNVIKENISADGIDHVLSNSFGFGGMNAVVIFSRYKG